MTEDTPRLRMFAGPNGSGKSTIKSVLRPELLGIYINPDDLEKEIRATGFLSLSEYGIETVTEEILPFFHTSSLLKKGNLLGEAAGLQFQNNHLSFADVRVNSYFASVVADFLRQKLLAKGRSFTFETVMSSPDKVEFLHRAQVSGYRTYLYYVATEDPEINISRVQHRVKEGGHSVPEEKIRERYYRSLELLFDAIGYSDRAYIFDNSGSERLWLAEVTAGVELESRADFWPAWFEASVVSKFQASD